VAEIKIPYYTVRRNGRGFWEPKPHMRALGFFNVPCGPDGPDAWAIAEEWNRRWLAVRRGEAPSPAMASADNLSPEQAEELTVYPPRSLGEAFRRYRRTGEWKNKKPRTREDWWRVWRRIKPVFGDCDPRTVTLEDISAWRAMIEETVSLREAHRCIKIWRAVWKVSAALGYCVRDADPSLGVRNRAAPGRSLTWTEGEAARLFKRAWREGYLGLAAVIAVAWDTQLSPGDVRTLCGSQLRMDAAGAIFFTERGKTGTPVGGELSKRTIDALKAYMDQLGCDLLPDTPIFRTRGHSSGDGRPWAPRPYTSDILSKDFRLMRSLEFGEAENRTLADFRRSGAVEAIAGDATPAALSHAMGNTLSASNALFATYVPVNLATLRTVLEARRRGRSKLR
jgi:integrase